jgi:hypothetical protein
VSDSKFNRAQASLSVKSVGAAARGQAVLRGFVTRGPRGSNRNIASARSRPGARFAIVAIAVIEPRLRSFIPGMNFSSFVCRE